MDVVELLRQVGLTQYEAEAYSTLVREGPLTGYELGKRSKVPLPRSYDVLERLGERGLALIQPGDPPRYLAEDPARFLNHLRSSMTARLEELAVRLTVVASPDAGEEFWVIRGHDKIRNRAAAMIGAAEKSVEFRLPAPLDSELGGLVAEGRGRDRRLVTMDGGAALADDVVLVVVDGCEVLAGTLATDRTQAVVTRNRALVAMARRCFAAARPRQGTVRYGETTETANDWLAWEEDKHRRLRLLSRDSHVA